MKNILSSKVYLMIPFNWFGLFSQHLGNCFDYSSRFDSTFLGFQIFRAPPCLIIQFDGAL